MNDFIKVAKALSDPNRVKIIKMLQHKRMCVCEIRALLQSPNRAFQNTLKSLRMQAFSALKRTGSGLTITLQTEAAPRTLQQFWETWDTGFLTTQKLYNWLKDFRK